MHCVSQATQIQKDLLNESPYSFCQKTSKPAIMMETAALCSFIDYLNTRSDEYDPIDVDAYVKAFQLSETDRSAFEARLCDYMDMCLSNRVLPYSMDFFKTLCGQHEKLKFYAFRHYLFAYAVFVSRPFSAGNVDLGDANIDSLMKIRKNEIESITYTSAFKNALFVAYEQLQHSVNFTPKQKSTSQVIKEEQPANIPMDETKIEAQNQKRKDALITATFGLAGLFLSKKGAGVKLLILSIVVIVLGVFYTMLQLSYGMEPSNGIGAISVGIILVIVSIIKIVIESQNGNR